MTLARQAMFTAAALLLAVPAMAQTSPASAFDTVEADYEVWLLRENPETATGLGVRDYDDRVSDPSIAAMDRRDNIRAFRRIDRVLSQMVEARHAAE